MRRALLFLLALGLPLCAQHKLTKLPDWAIQAGNEGLAAAPPANADAWVLLDRTVFAYMGDGEIREHRYRLVRILTERGLDEAIYVLYGLGGKASKLKKLKGWNCRPDGEVTKLDKDEVLTVDPDARSEVTTGLLTAARLERVVKESLVAFESLEVIQESIGPSPISYVLQRHPIRQWEMDLAKSDGWFTNLKQVQIQVDTRNFKPWLGVEDLHSGTSIRLKDIPSLPKNESGRPDAWDALPRINIRFMDPSLHKMPSLQTWDGIAQWYEEKFRAKAATLKLTEPWGKDLAANLRHLHDWLVREMTYMQVYLDPERSWIPEDSEEVRRKRYGDCKDLASLVIGGAKSLGLEAYPVLARMGGHISPEEPVGTGAFNHVIAAIRLPKSLGLPAEFETQQGRFLLLDVTARFTTFGYLPPGHRNRRLMICSPAGATWVAVPESAVQRPSIHFGLNASVELPNRVKGTLSIREEGDYLGLRTALGTGGRKALRDHLASHLDLPPTATWDFETVSIPMDLDKPLEVKVTLDHPMGLRHIGDDWTLAPLGMPTPPAQIQRSDESRRYPVEQEASGRWEVDATLSFPSPWQPLKCLQNLDTPFRSLRWTAEAQGGKIRFTFSQNRKDAMYGFDQREEGVKQQRKDRSAFKLFLEEGLSFRPKS